MKNPRSHTVCTSASGNHFCSNICRTKHILKWVAKRIQHLQQLYQQQLKWKWKCVKIITFESVSLWRVLWCPTQIKYHKNHHFKISVLDYIKLNNATLNILFKNYLHFAGIFMNSQLPEVWNGIGLKTATNIRSRPSLGLLRLRGPSVFLPVAARWKRATATRFDKRRSEISNWNEG